jgi:hypothetical protein
MLRLTPVVLAIAVNSASSGVGAAVRMPLMTRVSEPEWYPAGLVIAVERWHSLSNDEELLASVASNLADLGT